MTDQREVVERWLGGEWPRDPRNALRRIIRMATAAAGAGGPVSGEFAREVDHIAREGLGDDSWLPWNDPRQPAFYEQEVGER